MAKLMKSGLEDHPNMSSSSSSSRLSSSIIPPSPILLLTSNLSSNSATQRVSPQLQHHLTPTTTSNSGGGGGDSGDPAAISVLDPILSESQTIYKVKRFLSTLIQFGSDISTETGEKVKELVFNLVVSDKMAFGDFLHSSSIDNIRKGAAALLLQH